MASCLRSAGLCQVEAGSTFPVTTCGANTLAATTWDLLLGFAAAVWNELARQVLANSLAFLDILQSAVTTKYRIHSLRAGTFCPLGNPDDNCVCGFLW